MKGQAILVKGKSIPILQNDVEVARTPAPPKFNVGGLFEISLARKVGVHLATPKVRIPPNSRQH